MPNPKNKINLKTASKFRYKILLITSFMILFLSFSFNIFGLGLPGFFTNYQKDSEKLVTNELGCHYQHQCDLFGGMLVSGGGGGHPKDFRKAYTDCSTEIFTAYTSQFNIQGKIITFFAPPFPALMTYYVRFAKAVSVSLLAAAFAYLIITVAKEFSLITAITLLGGLLVSDWLVFIARNLYWVPILMFLPFIFSFCLYQKFKAGIKLKYFYLILASLFALKSLAGYEYITCVILASFTPILYYEIKSFRNFDLRRFLNPFLKVLLAGVAGFLVAVSLHITELALYVHSIPEAVHIVQNRAFERTAGEPGDDIIVNLIPQTQYIEPQLYSLVNNFYYLTNISHSSRFFIPEAIGYQILAFLFLGLYTSPFILRQPFDMLAQSVAFSLLISGIIVYLWKNSGLLKSSPKHLALTIATIYASLSSISWIIVAHPHVIHHLHLAGIVYYLPFALVFYILVGFALDSSLRKTGILKKAI
jgi:hypothetical protein